MKELRPCLKGLSGLLRPMLPKVLGSAALYLAEAACSLLFVWYSKKVVDIATGQADAPLTLSVVVLVAIMCAQVVLRVVSKRYEGIITVEAKLAIRRDAFDKAMRSVWNGQDKYHSADVVNRLEEDIRVVTEFLCVYLPSGIVTVIQLVASCVMLFAFSSSLALILIWIMPVAVLAAKLYFRKLRALSSEIRTLDGKIQGHVQEHLQSRTLVKTFEAEGRIEDELVTLQDEELFKTRQRLNYSAVSRTFMQVGFSAGYLTAFLWGVYGLRDGTVTYGLMVAFLQLVGQVQRPVASLASYIPAFIKALSSEERLLDIEDIPSEDKVEQVMLDGNLSLEVIGVDFAYDDRNEVFEGFSCVFPAGQMTSILGTTGRGKSTLAGMMLGLLVPSKGSLVLSNGTRSVQIGPQTRCNFMYVPQGNTLLSGSIRSNLLLADPDASDEEMRHALYTAGAEFVFDLPDGLDTLCREVGRGLSEGQAQRIAIARALLRKGGILLLDEATSALDAQTESLVLGRIHEEFYHKKTIICITHRNAAALLSDNVVNL